MARSVHPQAPSLLVWRERSEIERLQAERALLRQRINTLRPNCHRRVELTARLRDLTNRQLMLQIRIEDRP